MSTWPLAVAIKPIALFLFFLGLRAFTNAIERRMPDGKIKRLLFRRISSD
jgi:hypothetical protein